MAETKEGNGPPVLAVIPEEVSTKQELLESISQQLRFPAYFGKNWDALYECLTDLSWLPEQTVILRHEELPGIPGDELVTYLDVLANAVERWRTVGPRTLVVEFPSDEQKMVDRLSRGRLPPP